METKDNNVCTICMNIPLKDNIVTTECNHIYCSDCISEWKKRSNTCPTCRCILKPIWARVHIVDFNSKYNLDDKEPYIYMGDPLFYDIRNPYRAISINRSDREYQFNNNNIINNINNNNNRENNNRIYSSKILEKYMFSDIDLNREQLKRERLNQNKKHNKYKYKYK